MLLSELKPRLTNTVPKTLRKQLIEDALAKPTKEEVWATQYMRIYLENEEDYNWYIHEGDLWLDGDVGIDTYLLVTGDVIISGICSDDYDGMLLVLGDLRCGHMVSEQSICVWGDLICGGLCFQHYNDWVLEVQGTLSARLFISDDKSTHAVKMKADEYYHSYGTGEWTERYHMLGFRPPEDEDDDYDDEDEEEYPISSLIADLPPIPYEYGECIQVLHDRDAKGEDAFKVAFPEMSDLIGRWGEDWA